MYVFLMLLGFALTGASAFTAAYSRRWGERGGQLATSILRNVLGIPLWIVGFVFAWLAPAPLLFIKFRLRKPRSLLRGGAAASPQALLPHVKKYSK